MRLPVALALMLLLVAAPSAWGATSVTLDAAGALVVQGDAEVNAISITVVPGGAERVRDADSPVQFAGDSRCAQADDHDVLCTFGVVKSANVSGNDGDDTLTTDIPVPVVFDGGAGDDHLMGGGSSDVLRGGPGADVLDGGGGEDLLEGDAGSDVLRGGEGDDRLVAGDGASDGEISCGPGADYVRADPVADPQPADCELALAQFTGPVLITGSTTTAGTLHAEAPVAGTKPVFVTATWWSCAPGTSSCTSWRGGEYYPPTGADVGREIYVTVDAVNDSDYRFHGLDGTTSGSARVGPVTGDPRYVAFPHLPTGTSLRAIAAKALGGPAALTSRHNDIAAYIRSGARGILRLTGRPQAAIAVFSRHSVPVVVAQTLELRSRFGALRRINLAGATLTASIDTPGLVNVGLSSPQRRLLHRARRARLVVSLGGASGVVVRFRLPTR